jgi:hypothetical protein
MLEKENARQMPPAKKIKLEAQASAPVYKASASAASAPNHVTEPILTALELPRAEHARQIAAATRTGAIKTLDTLCTAADKAGIRWQAADMCDFYVNAVQPVRDPLDAGVSAVRIMAWLMKRYPNSFDASVFGAPLAHAVVAREFEAVEHLLGVCCGNPEQTNELGQSLIMFAAKVGDQGIYELLRFHDASPHAIDDHGNSVLHYAVRGNNERIVSDLVENCRVDRYGKNKLGQSAFNWCAESGNREVEAALWV